MKRAFFSAIFVAISYQLLLDFMKYDVYRLKTESFNVIGVLSTIGYLAIYLATKIIAIYLERTSESKG
jgi:hypothetical protein